MKKLILLLSFFLFIGVGPPSISSNNDQISSLNTEFIYEETTNIDYPVLTTINLVSLVSHGVPIVPRDETTRLILTEEFYLTESLHYWFDYSLPIRLWRIPPNKRILGNEDDIQLNSFT